MEIIKYLEDGILLTRCKYRPFTMVGSRYCIQTCKFFETVYSDEKIVYCKFKELINDKKE